MCSRILKALAFLAGAIVISVLILFISWAFFKYVDIPYDELVLNANQNGTTAIPTPAKT